MSKKEKRFFVTATADRLNMREEITGNLELCSRQLLNTMPMKGSWEWDDRFDVPLLVFPKDVEAEIDGAIKKCFPYQWDYSNIKTAPPAIRKLLDKTFGMQPGQTVFATDTNQEAFLFGLWWPWQDKKTISLRISLAGKDVFRFDQEEVGEYLRHWFQL